MVIIITTAFTTVTHQCTASMMVQGNAGGGRAGGGQSYSGVLPARAQLEPLLRSPAAALAGRQQSAQSHPAVLSVGSVQASTTG